MISLLARDRVAPPFSFRLVKILADAILRAGAIS
jgi:hypothetical protein